MRNGITTSAMAKKKKLKAQPVPKKTAAMIIQMMGVTKGKKGMASALVHPEMLEAGYVQCGWMGGGYYCVTKDGKLVLIKAVV